MSVRVTEEAIFERLPQFKSGSEILLLRADSNYVGSSLLAGVSIVRLPNMSESPTSSESNSLLENIETELKRNTPTSDDDDSGTSLTGTAKELFEVLEATDELLRTIDLDKLPDVLEEEELPNLFDFDHLADAIEEHNPDLAVHLSNLEEVVNKRELLDSIDLLEFGKSKRRLDRELEDVLGEDALSGGGGDSEAVSDLEEFVSSLRPEAAQALVQQEAMAKAEAVRDAIVELHAVFERLYISNKKRFRKADEGQTVRNPTAVSLLPSGPLPDSVSTRLSTVPSGVLHAKIKPLPRIYGRRWKRAESRRRR